MAKASDNNFPSVLLVEGSAPASPAASHQRLFIDSADHKLKRVDSAGAVTTVEGGGAGSGAVLSAHVIKTAGNYTINNTSWTTLDATLDLTLAAAVGDIIEVGLSAYVLPNSATQYAALDAVTLVSGAAVTSFSNATGSPASNGIPAWNIPGPAGEKGIGGSVMLTLISGDLSGGNVTVRLRYKTANAVNHTVRASTSDPLQFWIKNLKH